MCAEHSLLIGFGGKYCFYKGLVEQFFSPLIIEIISGNFILYLIKLSLYLINFCFHNLKHLEVAKKRKKGANTFIYRTVHCSCSKAYKLVTYKIGIEENYLSDNTPPLSSLLFWFLKRILRPHYMSLHFGLEGLDSQMTPILKFSMSATWLEYGESCRNKGFICYSDSQTHSTCKCVFMSIFLWCLLVQM